MSENLELRLSENLTKAMTDLVQQMFDSQKDQSLKYLEKEIDKIKKTAKHHMSPSSAGGMYPRHIEVKSSFAEILKQQNEVELEKMKAL